MIIIDNDYMINERALDVRSKLKTQDNPSNISDIFFKQLSNRVYDHVIKNSINFNIKAEIDSYLNQSDEFVADFKNALAEQALYVLSVGDVSLMLPDMTIQWISYDTWLKYRISPATNDILSNLGFLRNSIALE